MKRRFFTLLLCTALIFSAGCSKIPANSLSGEAIENNDNSSDDDNTVDMEDMEDTDNNDNETADTEQTPETDTEITENTSSQLYSVASQRYTDNIFSEEDASLLLMESCYDTIEIQGDGYDALKTAVSQWQTATLENLQVYIDSCTESAKEHSEQTTDFYGYSVSQTYQVMRSDTRILSILEDYYEYAGGAHPSYYISGINFDAVTGKRLTLEDIAVNPEEFQQQALAYVLDYLKNSDVGQEDGFYDDYESIIQETYSNTSWYFTAAGITFVYNPYEIAPYAAGNFEITLPAAEFEPLLKEEYRTSATTGYAYIPTDEVVTFSNTATGDTHYLSLNIEKVMQSYGSEEEFSYITLNSEKTPVAEWSSWLQNCYLIHQPNGRILLAAENSFMSDDYEMTLFDISNGSLEKVDSVYAAIAAPGVDTITLSTYLYVLGTYTGYRTYDISGNSIQPLGEEFYIPHSYSNLTTIKELPATDSTGAEVLLPVGSVLKPVATDEESYIRLKDIATDSEYTVHFTRDEYHITIDGIDEYEYFEMIPYAG